MKNLSKLVASVFVGAMILVCVGCTPEPVEPIEYTMDEFYQIMKDTEVTHITAESSVPGLTISEDKKTVNIYDVKLTGVVEMDYANKHSIIPDSIETADLSGIDFSDAGFDWYDSGANFFFYECYNLSEVILPNTIASIGEYMFSGCYNLYNITIPDYVYVIYSSAFERTNLTTVIIPDHVYGIQSFAFYESSLSNVIFPDSLEFISSHAFSGCDLTSVTIPDSVKEIGMNAFEDVNTIYYKGPALENSIYYPWGAKEVITDF